MSRPDESISFLKDRGYCVLRLPRSDARPLQTLLLSGKKDLVRLGELANITAAGTNPIPALSSDNQAPIEISGKESSSTKIEVGVSILGNIIQALGGNTLGIAAGYSRAKTLTFKYDEVLEDHIDIDKLDQYLTTCSFRLDGTAVGNALIKDLVFVVTSTLKTKKFTVNAQGEGGTKVELDVPAISGIASGSLKVETSNATEGLVTYEGAIPVVFGFQAVKIFTEDRDGHPVFTAMDPLKAGAAASRAPAKMGVKPLQLDEGAFFRMEDVQQSPAAGTKL
jgi:hypothetical protein